MVGPVWTWFCGAKVDVGDMKMRRNRLHGAGLLCLALASEAESDVAHEVPPVHFRRSRRSWPRSQGRSNVDTTLHMSACELGEPIGRMEAMTSCKKLCDRVAQ